MICDKVDGGHLASCHWFKLATHATLVVMARWDARNPCALPVLDVPLMLLNPFPLRKLLQ